MSCTFFFLEAGSGSTTPSMRSPTSVNPSPEPDSELNVSANGMVLFTSHPSQSVSQSISQSVAHFLCPLLSVSCRVPVFLCLSLLSFLSLSEYLCLRVFSSIFFFFFHFFVTFYASCFVIESPKDGKSRRWSPILIAVIIFGGLVAVSIMLLAVWLSKRKTRGTRARDGDARISLRIINTGKKNSLNRRNDPTAHSKMSKKLEELEDEEKVFYKLNNVRRTSTSK